MEIGRLRRARDMLRQKQQLRGLPSRSTARQTVSCRDLAQEQGMDHVQSCNFFYL